MAHTTTPKIQLLVTPKQGSTQPATMDTADSNLYPVISTVLLILVSAGLIGGIVTHCKLRNKHEHLKQKYQSQVLEIVDKNHDGALDDKNKYKCFPCCFQHNDERDYHSEIESLECGTLLKQSPSNATETTDIQRGLAEAADVPHGSAKAADRQHESAVTTTQRESNRNSQVCGTDEPDDDAGHDGNRPSGENVVHEFPLHQTFSGKIVARPTDGSDHYPSHIVPSSHVSGGNQPFMRSISTQPPDDESRPVPVRNQTNHQPSVRTRGTLNQAPSRSANASSNSGSVVIHSPQTGATYTVPETSHSQTLTNRNLQSQPPARSAAASSSAGFRPIPSSDAVQNQRSVNSHSPVQPSRPSAVHSQPLVSPNAPQQALSGPRVAHNQEAARSHAEARLSAIPSAAQPARSVAAHGHPLMGQNQPSVRQNQPSYGHNMASGGYNSRLQRQQPGVPQPGHAVGADSGQGTLFVDSALLDSLGPTPSDYAEQIERAYAEAEEELEAHPSQRGCHDNVSIDSSETSEHPAAGVRGTFAMDLDERITSPVSSAVRKQQQLIHQCPPVVSDTKPKSIDNHVPSETPPNQASGETVPVKETPSTKIRQAQPGKGKLIKQTL